MTVTVAKIARREPMESAEAMSAATIERVWLADGQQLVYKHLPPAGDWLTRASGDRHRMRDLWESGALHRAGTVVDHAVVGMIEEPDHDVLVMRDVSEHLVGATGRVSRDVSRRMLAGLAALHDLGRLEPAQALCPVGARYAMFAPAVHENDPGPGVHPLRKVIVRGWEVFAERVEPDVAAAVFAVHRDPMLLSDRLMAFPTTLVHGDTKLANLGLGPSGLVAIDWGDLTGFGPPEVDVAWYALMNMLRIDGTPDDAFADYEAAAAVPLDPTALDVVCVGSLAQMGFRFAGSSVLSNDAELRARSGILLDWWVARVRTALERLGGL